MRKKTIIFIGFVWLILMVGGFLLLQTYYKPIEMHVLNFDINVTSGPAGFNLDEDLLHFGSISPGGSTSREITINNSDDFKKRVDVGMKFVRGLINGYIPKSVTDEFPDDDPLKEETELMRIIVNNRHNKAEA